MARPPKDDDATQNLKPGDKTQRAKKGTRIGLLPRGFVVRGALVFVRSTPLVTSTPAEQVTNQSGFATLTAFPRATFPLKPGFHVQFFLRTRKEGDSLLAGVSSRRLAQVATR